MTNSSHKLFVALLVASSPALAESTTSTDAVKSVEPAKPTPTSLARIHFQNGLASASRGELELAVRQFRAAYELQPHFSVLYNIGQAETTLGHSLQAVEAFERYLRDGSEHVLPGRRQQVLDLIATNRKLIGSLQLVVAEPDRTRVWLDGLELNPDHVAQPIQVKTGEHTLIYSNGTGFPVSQRVTVTSSQVTEVRLEAPAETPARPSGLAISCAIPAVSVDIQGGPRLLTPVEQPVSLPAGQRRIRFMRPGYRPTERTLQVPAQGLARVDCGLQVLPQLMPELRAGLQIHTKPDRAETFVDGQRFTGAPVPAGLHDIRVERIGYHPLTTTLNLVAGHIRIYSVTLKPTRAWADEQARARTRRHTLAYVIAGTSAALLLTSGALYLWNSQRYEEFERGKTMSSQARNLEFATSIQRVDDLAIGLFVGGVLGGAASIWAFQSAY